MKSPSRCLERALWNARCGTRALFVSVCLTKTDRHLFSLSPFLLPVLLLLRQLISESVSDSVRLIFGPQFWNDKLDAIESLGDFLYFAFTTGCNSQTLGEGTKMPNIDHRREERLLKFCALVYCSRTNTDFPLSHFACFDVYTYS